ncbi:MAG: hypothetical protein LWW95_03210 [Candidatus Desulfofervidus auxilii]|nr:hypothetical protein [Candidatus Desulfofervidus auxilii]
MIFDLSKQLANCCEKKLNLKNACLSEEYYYFHLPLCVIDAIFSIGVQYSSTRNTVIRFCNYFGLKRTRPKGSGYPPKSKQLSIQDFIKIYEKIGITNMAEKVYCNRQRTSTKNGILKSEAVLRFSKVLNKYKVQYLQDVYKIVENRKFEQEIKQIPGQRSGISLRYFYMLAGKDNFIKPDRMIIRFVESCLRRPVNVDEVSLLIKDTCKILQKRFPSLTPRLLDHEIWKYQRKRRNLNL